MSYDHYLILKSIHKCSSQACTVSDGRIPLENSNANDRKVTEGMLQISLTNPYSSQVVDWFDFYKMKYARHSSSRSWGSGLNVQPSQIRSRDSVDPCTLHTSTIPRQLESHNAQTITVFQLAPVTAYK